MELAKEVPLNTSRAPRQDVRRETERAGRQLRIMEHAFGHGNILALIDAVLFCEKCSSLSLSLPVWALRAVGKSMIARLQGHGPRKTGRHASTRQEYLQRLIDFERYETVEQCKEYGYSYMDFRAEIKWHMDHGCSAETAEKRTINSLGLRTKRSGLNFGHLEKNENRHALFAAFENAVTVLDGRPSGGKVDAIRASYTRVKKNLDCPGYYYSPLCFSLRQLIFKA